jgi:hypothetical protein
MISTAIVLLASISIASFEAVNTSLKLVNYRGRDAVYLVPSGSGDTHMLALLKDSSFKDGTIEVDLAGAPNANAPAASRGFVGLAFRVEGDGARYECFYLRPTNGRADDQLRRNHIAQYVAHPDHPWHELRKSHPGVYESYVDIEAGAWTSVKIVVAGRKAKLYVNGASQPCLIVNDLKHEGAEGAVALWSHVSTDAYFSNLIVRQETTRAGTTPK